MNRRTSRVALLIVLVLAAVMAVSVTACSLRLPTDVPGITGDITSVVPGDGRPASIFVEGGKQPDGAVAQAAMVTIQPGTQVFGPDGKTADPATIVQGATVKVWFEGPVAESFPVQGSAGAVQVVKTP